MKDPKKVADGKRSKRLGSDFERRVRLDLEEKGWIVDRWTNNVEGKLVPAKTNRFQMRNTGFPDFVAFQKIGCVYEIIGVECKMNGKLDKEEKEKCGWLLENEIFEDIFIASKHKEKNKVKIIYEEFKWKS